MGFNNKIRNKDAVKVNGQKQERKKENISSPKQEKGRTLKVLGLQPDITNEDLYVKKRIK